MFDKEKTRVGVLMGGLSSEWKISLQSGQAVTKALTDRGWNAVSIDVTHARDGGAEPSDSGFGSGSANGCANVGRKLRNDVFAVGNANGSTDASADATEAHAGHATHAVDDVSLPEVDEQVYSYEYISDPNFGEVVTECSIE